MSSEINFSQKNIYQKCKRFIELKIRLHQEEIQKLAKQKNIPYFEAERIIAKEKGIYQLYEHFYEESLPPDDVARDLRNHFLETFFERGLCLVLSDLWLIEKSQGNEEAFFKDIQSMLNWDDTESALIKDNGLLNRLFDQLINDIVWLKTRSELLDIYHTEFDVSVNTLSGKEIKLKDEFKLSGLFVREELPSILEKILKNKKMVQISSSTHQLGIFPKTEIIDGQKTMVYYYYDSNYEGSEKKFFSVEKVALELEKDCFTSFKHDAKFMPFNFSVYDWEDKKNVQEIKYLNNDYESFLKNDPKFLSRISWDNHNLLTFACLSSNVSLLKFCLKHGMKPDVTGGRKKSTALVLAIFHGGSSVLQELIKAGVDVNLKDHHNQTPLYTAVALNRPKAVEILCQHGAEVRDPQVLAEAASQGNLEIIRILCEHKADVNALFQDSSILYHAILNNQWDAARLLIHYGANPYEELFTAIQEPSEYGREMLEFLVGQLKDIHVVDGKTGSSLLHKAVLYEDETIVKLLCEHGEDIHQKNFKNESPMTVASSDMRKILTSFEQKDRKRKKDLKDEKKDNEDKNSQIKKPGG